MADITNSSGSAADIPRLDPLWVSVHHQHQASMPELAPYVSDEATWHERRALESIAVAPDHRGAGIGTQLLDAVDAEMATRGIGDVIIGALPGIEGALPLYERRGFRPTWLYLSRFQGR